MNRFMLQLIVRRIGAGLLTLLIVSAVVFFITSLLPGDAAQLLLGQNATAETVTALREQLGLDSRKQLLEAMARKEKLVALGH
ncbi:hypothetical protein ACTXQV_67520, partial [Klebsiella pneumoniae]